MSLKSRIHEFSKFYYKNIVLFNNVQNKHKFKLPFIYVLGFMKKKRHNCLFGKIFGYNRNLKKYAALFKKTANKKQSPTYILKLLSKFKKFTEH